MDPQTMFLLAQERAAERQREAHNERLAHLSKTRKPERSPVDGILTLAAVRRLVASTTERARLAFRPVETEPDCDEVA